MEKMRDVLGLASLGANLISEVQTSRGYMQLLEYTLPDLSLVHVISWHFNDLVMEFDGNSVPKFQTNSFFRDKLAAVSFAEEIGNELLKCI